MIDSISSFDWFACLYVKCDRIVAAYFEPILYRLQRAQNDSLSRADSSDTALLKRVFTIWVVI